MFFIVLSMQTHVQACICWSKYTTIIIQSFKTHGWHVLNIKIKLKTLLLPFQLKMLFFACYWKRSSRINLCLFRLQLTGQRCLQTTHFVSLHKRVEKTLQMDDQMGASYVLNLGFGFGWAEAKDFNKGIQGKA